MDIPADQLAVIILNRYRDKSHKDYTKEMETWDIINRKLLEIISLKSYSDAIKIWSATVTDNVLRIVYSTERDLEVGNRQTFVCDSSYLDMDYYDMKNDWESLQADLEARQKEIENERARGARYRYYLRLRAEFDPDFVPPEDY